MGKNLSIHTKEVVSMEDAQNIINSFPEHWIMEGNRAEKPIKQDWGWFTIVCINNPREEILKGNDIVNPYGYWNLDGSDYGTLKTVSDFIIERLKEKGYTFIDTDFSE